MGYPYGRFNGCPVDLIPSLASVLQSLYGGYGYGGIYPYGAGFGGVGLFGAYGGSAGATNNQYWFSCPWDLINSMLQRISDETARLQANAQGQALGQGPLPFPFAYNAPGRGPFMSTPIGRLGKK